MFAQIFAICNGNAVCLFSPVEKNICSFIHYNGLKRSSNLFGKNEVFALYGDAMEPRLMNSEEA